MPFLKSMEISGFRSYSSTNPQFVKFKSPLTLILGKNGSGKTTILEVLRYVCSGQFPPNSQQGKTFIRDPFLDNTQQTQAYVELIFQSVYDNQITAKRNSRLSRGKKESYKNMGQYILVNNKQEEPFKVDQNLAQFDKTVPFLLGSNKEVLENVILCHQEDQFWMFQDPNQLKKIFDSIFNSTHISKFAELCNKKIKIKQKSNIQDSYETKFSKIEYDQFQVLKKDLVYQIQQLIKTKTNLSELKELILSHPDYQKLDQIERQIGNINSKISLNQDLQIQIQNEINSLNFNSNQNFDEQQINQEIEQKQNQKKFLDQKIEQLKHNQENLGILVLQQQINTLLLKVKFNIIDDQDFCHDDYLQDIQKKLYFSKEQKQIELEQITKEYSDLKESKENVLKGYNKKLEDLKQKQKEQQNLENQKKAYYFQVQQNQQVTTKKELEESLQELQNDITNQQYQKAKQKEKNLLLKRSLILQNIKEKQQGVQLLCNKYDWKILTLNDLQLVMTDIDKKMDESQKEINQEKAELNYLKKQILEKQNETTEIENQKNELIQLLKNKKIVSKQNKNPLEKFLQMKTEIKQLKTQIICFQEDMDITEKLIQQSSKNNECQICLQNIESENIQIMNLTFNQKKQIYIKNKNMLQKQLDLIQDDYNQQKQFKEKITSFQNCVQKLDQFDKDIKDIINKKKSIDNNLNTLENQMIEFKKMKNLLQSIQIKLGKIEELQNKIDFDQTQIKDQEQSSEEIQDQIYRNEKQIESIDLYIQNIHNKISKVQHRIQQTQNKIVAIQEEILNLGFSINSKIENPEKIEQENYQQQIMQTQQIMSKQKDRFQKQINTVEQNRLELKLQMSFYQDCIEKINEFIDKNTQENTMQQKNDLYEKINDLKQQIQILTSKRQFLKLNQQLTQVEIQNRQLKTELQNHVDKKQLLKQGKQQYDKLKDQISEIKGKQKIFKEQILTSIIKLRDQTVDQENKNVIFKAIFHNVRNQINQVIVEDFKYINKSLEQACININKEQIETINKTIKNIWLETYSSKDIQTLSIKSEPKKNNKTELQYKIFAIDSQGKKMDFKSKASAGQKMLASIVIRLALAELYSQQCGIFALDEPTTNLDHENIILLANFLKRLVDLKKQDENFQLIVITHDIQFLKQMGGIINSYYEVKKNKNGYSNLKELSMGISRDSRHKRRLTGGRMPIHQKKRVYESGRPMAHTRLGEKRIKKLRVRGGNYKYRALRLNTGNYNWQSEGIALKTKILNVVYNASNNELVRTNTLVKNTIVRVDATPFKNYVLKHYFGTDSKEAENQTLDMTKWSEVQETKDRKLRKYQKRRKNNKLDVKFVEQLQKGLVLACISSRPGQSGRADGYLLEGKELEFYSKKLEKK